MPSWIWATHSEASPKPESEAAWQAGLCLEDEKRFAYDRMLFAETHIDQILQLPQSKLKKMCLGMKRRFRLPLGFRKTLKGLCDRCQVCQAVNEPNGSQAANTD